MVAVPAAQAVLVGAEARAGLAATVDLVADRAAVEVAAAEEGCRAAAVDHTAAEAGDSARAVCGCAACECVVCECVVCEGGGYGRHPLRCLTTQHPRLSEEPADGRRAAVYAARRATLVSFPLQVPQRASSGCRLGKLCRSKLQQTSSHDLLTAARAPNIAHVAS